MDGISTESASFRLSPQQQQLLADRSAPEVTQCAIVLDGPVDVDGLRAALAGAAARHEVLRTTFVKPAGMRIPQQVIGEESERSFTLREEDSSELLIDDRTALEELMAREAEGELDLKRDPPLRALLAGAKEKRTVLLITAWAACADASSLLALVRELCERYGDGHVAQQEPVQYADYAEWRHELIAGGKREAQAGLDYWRQDAAARPTPPRILFAQQTGPSGARPAFAPLELTEIGLDDLHEAAASAGASIPLFLEAAWHTLLARLSGASELLLAGWCTGREQPDLADAIGPYEQPAPIHSRYQETTTFAEILDQVRRSRAAAVRHQDCGTAEHLAALAQQATAGWAFHTVGRLGTPARRLLALRLPPAGTRLLLAVRSGESGLSGELCYDPLAVPQADAHELAGRFATLLRSALTDPSAPVAQLAIMDEAERQRLFSAARADVQDQSSCAPSGASDAEATESVTLVHELLERQARLTPQRLAVVSTSGSLTYEQLETASSRLANHLRELGHVRQQTVGLCMERKPSMVVALMAILKAGGAYLPINYEHPQARISHQLTEAGVRLVISEQHLLSNIPALDATVVCVDRDAEAVAARCSQSPDSSASPENVVYVMYTSGSTGTPKGVAVTHGNLANYVAAIAARLSDGGGRERDGGVLTFGVVSAISTDLGNTSIFAPLAHGGCIRLIGAEASMDGDLLADELAGERLDALKIAPSHLRALLAAANADVLPRRWLIVGGEALSWELVEQVRSLSPGCRILNHYGPTETTIGCTAFPVDRRRSDSATVPIGFPLAGVRTYVLDRRSQPVPVGVPGELCVAGAGVAAGYLGAAEQSDGGFAPDPFTPPLDAGRMYRTGDRVRLLRDGAIEFLGRLDDQVKIRGFRVQPGEVESALLGHVAIRQVAVCAEDDHSGGLRLAAYIVSPDPPTVDELRAFLGEILPDHMIPSVFRTAEALPLNASGKIDRSALAGIAELQARREADYLAPRDAVEQQIAEIWGELLGVERVGALDDFFALGGHSLLATQATIRIRRLYGDIPLRALLAAPTVAELAEVVRATVDDGVPAR
jgi:amino acid adenylation domain-containing protein